MAKKLDMTHEVRLTRYVCFIRFAISWLERGFSAASCIFIMTPWFMNLWCVWRQHSHTGTLIGQTQRHTITQHSLMGDLIKPEGKCNYMQPSSALFCNVIPTCCLWVESLCAYDAIAHDALAVWIHRDANTLKNLLGDEFRLSGCLNILFFNEIAYLATLRPPLVWWLQVIK